MALTLQEPRFVQDVAAPLTTSETHAQAWTTALYKAREWGAQARRDGKPLSFRLTVEIFRTTFATAPFKESTVFSQAVWEAVQDGWKHQFRLEQQTPQQASGSGARAV